jgi:hypothetical protein
MSASSDRYGVIYHGFQERGIFFDNFFLKVKQCFWQCVQKEQGFERLFSRRNLRKFSSIMLFRFNTNQNALCESRWYKYLSWDLSKAV